MAETKYTQSNRPIGITTPLGDDKLLLEQFKGVEGVSRPFRFRLIMLSEPGYTVPFDQLLGQAVTVRLDLADSNTRYFNGVIYRLSEAGEVYSSNSDKTFLRYVAEMVPAFWLMRNQVRSRIFQHKSVPDILKDVLDGNGISYTDEIQGTFDERDYCAQYRESDFQFASRLMEEEGIFYFFKHTDSEHKMVLANKSSSYADLPDGATLEFEDYAGLRDRRLHDDRITRWEKTQEVRAGHFRLWDHCFEMPDKNLEATADIPASATVGTVTHMFKVGTNDQWELYEYPGGYAQRYDGINSGGGEQASDLSKIEQDNVRTVGIRMQQEATPGLVVEGEGNVRRLTPGFKFTFDKHFNANGSYGLIEVEHAASMEGTYTTNESTHLMYSNRFRCMPDSMLFVPPRTTPRPRVQGNQTAVVVGNDDTTEIAPDKYGRVKVQFFWDRDGKLNLDSSCWVRVAQLWAGKQWGAIFIPRVGDEVIVAFLEGDPDQPIIVGSVYNADHMPPYTLPDNKTQSGLKTRSTTKGDDTNFNELRFEDKIENEEIYFHAEKDFNRVVENNDTLKVGFDKQDKGDQTIDIYNDRTTTLDQGNETLTVKTGKRTVTVQADDTHEIQQGNLKVQVDAGNATYEIQQGNLSVTVDMGNSKLDVTAGSHTVTAGQSIKLSVGANSITIDQTGITLQATQINIKGTTISINGEGKIGVDAPMTTINGDATLALAGGVIQIG